MLRTPKAITMGAVELRNKMIGYVEEADECLLNVLKAVVESYKENDVVAFTSNGNSLTNKQYNQELLDAEEEISLGEFTTQEDLEKEAENW